jgi:predicted esterase
LPGDSTRALPLLLLLHPTGESEHNLLAAWKSLAGKEQIVLAAPSSRDVGGWSAKYDPPGYINAVIKDAATKHAIDNRRIYVFGFSAGARYAIKLCLTFPASFAACGSAMGALEPKYYSALENSDRKVPLILFAGAEDQIVPEGEVIATRDALRKANYEVELHTFSDQDHDYYRRADEVNKIAWKFFAAHTLNAGRPGSASPGPAMAVKMSFRGTK